MKRFHVLALALVAMMLISADIFAAKPNLQRAYPPGVQRGKEVEISLRGSRMDDAQEVMFFEPGVTMKSIEAEDDKNSFSRSCSW